MIDRLLEFSGALRQAGVPVSMTEESDALTAIRYVDLAERNSVKAALSAAMLKNQAHRPQFETLFDLYFGTGRGDTAGDTGGTEGSLDRDALVRELIAAIIAGDTGALGDVARRAVAAFGRLQNSPSGDWYSNYQVMRALDLDSIEELLAAHLDDSDMTRLERQLARDEFEARLQEFRAIALGDTRRRVAEQRGPEAVARYAVNPVPPRARGLVRCIEFGGALRTLLIDVDSCARSAVHEGAVVRIRRFDRRGHALLRP
jgi:uncharacterized protein with von Willebrand factor type A (vWA) domain